MTTQGELPLTISLGQRHGGLLVCYNQASDEHQGAGPEMLASSPSEDGLWAEETGEEIGEECYVFGCVLL